MALKHIRPQIITNKQTSYQGPEDQGNLVQEIGKSVEVQEIQGGSGGPGRSVKSREVQRAFGRQVNFEMELLSGVVKGDPVHCSGVPGDLDGTYSDEICPFSISSSSGFSTHL